MLATARAGKINAKVAMATMGVAAPVISPIMSIGVNVRTGYE
jgi:Na+-driven multidrug efflux pump